MNSLTANNRLSQQLVVSVAEHLLLRHECRLPNHLAVSNHRELYLTVGGELCRNLTAGFVTEEGFMSMLFVGSQKHSALSIFAKTTRMSALVLCGNSGVILLSVKDHQHIDSAIPGRYTVQAPYKAGAGIGVLEKATAYNRVDAVFLYALFCHAQIMVGRTGASQDAPVRVAAGNANSVRLTTSMIGVLCGEFFKLATEAAIMATIPTFVHPEITIINGRAVTTSLAVANYFTKRHERVLDRIRNLECSAEFAEHNFVLSGYQHIADQCEISKRSVMNHIAALCESGLVKKVTRKGEKGNSSNIYLLHLDGAGDSLGGSANNSLSGAANSPGSAGVAPGGSAGDSPRTSHSFEPVKEPVNEPIAVGASVDESVRVRSNRPEYSPEFEQAWLAYPKRAGGNSKSAAFKAWKARLNEGVNPETMLEGVKRYAGWVSAMGNSGTQFVKQAVTFFGPDRHFEESWEVPAVSAARREDPYFKASYDNVDYSQIPAGFRG